MNKNFTLRAFWLLLLCTGATKFSAGQSNTILHSDFEGGSLSLGWDALEACCSYSMTTTTAFKRTGNRSLRVELRKGDLAIGGNKRVELTDNSYPIPHETNRKWWSFSSYFPTGFVKDSVHEILAQWHYRSTQKYVSASPPLSLQVYKGDWIVEIRYDSVDINVDNGANIKLVRYNLGPWQAGAWTDWVFNYNYSVNNDGYVKIWKNGELVLDHKGKNWYRGSYDPFFKIGLYRWVWGAEWPTHLEQSIVSSRVYYLDNIKIGNQHSILQDFLIPDSNVSNIVPVVTAGQKQTIPVPYHTATLKSAGSMDPDGSIVSYQWTVDQGPNMPTIQSATVPDLKVANMVQGKYVYKLTATDNRGAKSCSTAEIVITGTTAANQLPIVNAGATQIVTLPVNSTRLSASGTFDPDGSIVKYAWSQESGPFTALITGANTASPTVSALQNGSYYFKLTVTDNRGAFSSAYVHVFVNGIAAPVNLAPVASAGTAQEITLPVSSVALSGSGSFDTDGTITTYNWSQASGPATAVFSNAASVNTNVTGLVVGTYEFSLSIRDNSGAADTAKVLVKVNPVPEGVNLPPVSNAGANSSYPYFYSTITLRGNLSNDPDGSIVSYQWTQDSGPGVLLSTPDSVVTIARNVAVSGVYVFRLTVTDNLGMKSSSTITITLLPALDGVSGIPQPNQAPVSNPGSNQTFQLLWSTITMNGRQSYDPDGAITAYRWIQESGQTLEFLYPDSSQNLARNLVPGTYVFRLAVTDNRGAVSSASVTYNLLPEDTLPPPPPPNIEPVAEAGNDQTFTLFYNTISMNGSLSSDADGTIQRYRWDQEAGPQVLMSFPDSVINIARNIVAGTYRFRLVVTDNRGGTDTARITVNVLPAALAAADPASIAKNSVRPGRVALRTSEQLWNWDEKTVVIYPNPIKNELFLKMNNTLMGRFEIRLFDLNGALLQRQSFDKTGRYFSSTLYLSNIPPGSYLLHVVQGGHTVLTKKVNKLD